MSVERLYIAGGLGLRESTKGKGFSRDREIGTHRIDKLQEQSTIWTSLMELSC